MGMAKGYLLSEIEFLLMPAQNNAIRTNNVKKKICNRQQNSNSGLRESLNKFPDFFRMGTFIDSTHMKL